MVYSYVLFVYEGGSPHIIQCITGHYANSGYTIKGGVANGTVCEWMKHRIWMCVNGNYQLYGTGNEYNDFFWKIVLEFELPDIVVYANALLDIMLTLVTP